MTNKEDRIKQLLNHLENILERQAALSEEIHLVRNEIKSLKENEEPKEKQLNPSFEKPIIQEKIRKPTTPSRSSAKIKLDFEKFIGENLINKIGILITIIGISIGIKYSIDHDLITPVTRVILGYAAGISFLGIGIKLKKKYKNYSAVLVSGAISILYFITYAAFSFFALMPQIASFIIMVLLTIFAILMALNYDKQIIAHIGLVASYAIPFLLGNNSGNVIALFGYISIINIGILIISIRKYWKPLYYSSFVATWIIFFFWYILEFKTDQHYTLALTFSTIFFAIFYLAFLAYKLRNKEKFEIENVALLLTNSFVFYGIVYSILSNHGSGRNLLGAFTVGNGILHSIVSIALFKLKTIDKHLTRLISGVAILFITISIPVQLDGNWVTFLWAGEAALLFWIGRAKDSAVYERLSYPLIILAFISMLHDWSMGYNGVLNQSMEKITPLINITFLTSLFFAASTGFISVVNKKYLHIINPQSPFSRFFTPFISILFFFTLYYMFRLEIESYWGGLSINHQSHNDLSKFKTIWIINYSLFFVSTISFLNILKLRDKLLGLINLTINILIVAVFLVQGLYALSELRETYLEQSIIRTSQDGTFNIVIRYVSYCFVGLVFFACQRLVKSFVQRLNLKIFIDSLIHIAILWIVSSELINWLDIAGLNNDYKLELSILWGLYSLLLIILGIWKTRKYLRIGAIILFGVTLIKLFLYDITHLSTIAKTVAFVSLGILLLVISFLYNKYRHLISGENEGSSI